MNHSRPAGLLLAALTLVGLVYSLSAPAWAADTVAVVVNKSNSTPELNLDAVRKLFMGDKSTWPNGRRVTVLLNAPGSPERELVLRQVYKMNDGEYTKYFMQAAFTGRVQTPPRDVDSAQVKKMVADNPGAIGCIRKEEVDDSVRVILTIP